MYSMWGNSSSRSICQFRPPSLPYSLWMWFAGIGSCRGSFGVCRGNSVRTTILKIFSCIFSLSFFKKNFFEFELFCVGKSRMLIDRWGRERQACCACFLARRLIGGIAKKGESGVATPSLFLFLCQTTPFPNNQTKWVTTVYTHSSSPNLAPNENPSVRNKYSPVKTPIFPQLTLSGVTYKKCTCVFYSRSSVSPPTHNLPYLGENGFFPFSVFYSMWERV